MDWDDTTIPDLTGQVSVAWEQRPLRGGYANVYRGQWKGKAVAIKTLVAHHSVSLKSMLRRIKREGCIWANLDHPNILPLYGTMNDGSYDAFVSPWCPGGDSSTYLEQNGNALSLDERLRLFNGVANGIAYLHGFTPKLVHGDIKPANVLIDELGNPRLCDFGLARVFLQEGSTGLSTTTAHTGTGRYLAPELLMDKDASPSIETDVYALGCVGLKFIFLREPYDHHANNLRGDIFVDIRSGKPPASNLSEPGTLESKIWEIIVSCWRPQPIQRPSASEVISMLVGSVPGFLQQQQQQRRVLFASSISAGQGAADQAMRRSVLTAEASAAPGSIQGKKDLDTFMMVDNRREEKFPESAEEFDLNTMFGLQSAWANANPTFTITSANVNMNEYLINVNQNEHAQMHPFRSLQATHANRNMQSQSPIINIGDFTNIPGKLNLAHNPHNFGIDSLNPTSHRVVDTTYSLPGWALPSRPAGSSLSGLDYKQHHINPLPLEAHFNMVHQQPYALFDQITYPNPTLPVQPAPQALQAGPSTHLPFIPASSTKQEQHGPRQEINTKLLHGAFKLGSYRPDPSLRALLELIRQQPFYRNDTFEPSLETVEAEHLLAFVRVIAPEDPRFAPRNTDIHNSYAPPTGTNRPPKNSIYILFTENNKCLLCGKQKSRSRTVLAHVRWDLGHRPYHCDCNKCTSGPKPKKFCSDYMLDDHKKGHVVKQCPRCLISVREANMKLHMRFEHSGELLSVEGMESSDGKEN